MAKIMNVLVGGLPTVLTLASLACLLLVAVPRSRFLNFEFATVDTYKVSVTVGQDTFKGLPDAYDYSKHKDFYKIYLWHYCSGTLQDGKQHVDFCSKAGHLLYGLFGFWKHWGVGVRRAGGVGFYWLGKGPRMLFVSYLIAIALSCLTLISGFLVKLHPIVRKVAFGLASLSTSTILATAILTQVTYGVLISRADDDDIAITAKSGKVAYIINWISVCLSLAALAITYLRQRQSSSQASAKSRSMGKEKYKMVADPYVQEGTRDSVHLLDPVGQEKGVAPSPRTSHDGERYEPYRVDKPV
ncbi:hypothetical protein P154DRAFT_624990 [Amniculicola lignicola CBS 123094]|uniref:SUR7-domain-containing protein n=1 Tax=Amniculicola lignicola CBS 123094 TaxID=1392246 RepID=A0A6A5VYP8_9PLEO|nr:hypothetical protein P154DRAFT_624990 [Amniculicola lignicola CBS 123094]